MNRKKHPALGSTELRRRAAQQLEQRSTRPQGPPRRPEDADRLLHELEVHQIELELQNEELVATRAQLEAGLERYTDLYDFAPMGYLTLDAATVIEEANLAAGQLLGVPRSRLIGGRFGHFLSPEHRAPFDAFLRRVLETQVKEVCEVALSTSAWLHVEAIVSGPGRRAYRVVLVDVTERRRLEEALRFRSTLLDYASVHSLEELLRKALGAIGALTNSPIGSYHFVEADQRTLTLKAWLPAGEVLRAGTQQAIDPAELWAECVRRRRPTICNEVAPRPHRPGLPSGWPPIARELAAPIIRSNVVVALVVVGNKATDYTARDVEIVSHLADLAWGVIERKRAQEALEESERRYREAAEALREVDRNKTQFLATLSHELRNPLGPITSSLHVLRRVAPDGAQARRALEVVDRQVHQLARLVNDLLDATRISGNKISLSRERLDLAELVRCSADDHRSQFEDRGVHLELLAASARVFVDGDSSRLSQAVGNLLQNSVKFTPPGGRTTIQVSADLVAGRALVRVVDTGLGMDAGLLARLFQPFVQGDSTLVRSQGGLGLGLALVKTVVELHGGDITARSAGLGSGTEFLMRLPLMADEVVVPVARPPPASAGRRRVLVIDDNVDAAESLRDVLELGAHEVELAHTGPEGIAKARAFRPDVVLSDIGLPGMDGYAVARALQADETLRGTYLVALSGYALPDDVERARLAGFHRHLGKPPDLEKLAAYLAESQGRVSE